MQQVIDYYDDDKNPRRNFFLKNGKRAGQYIEFYRNNLIHKLKYYDDVGIPISNHFEYHESGHIRSIIHYSFCGKKTQQSVFFENQTLCKQFFFNERGKLHGKYITFYQNKSLRSIFFFNNGLLCNQAKLFHPNGKLKKVTKYDDKGNRNGVMKKFYETGRLQFSRYYRKDKLDGVSFEYHQNGNSKSTMYHMKGKLYGIYFCYDENGKIRSKTDYFNNLRHGFHVEYSCDIILESTKYKHGQKNGKSFLYDKFGNLEYNLNFKDNKLDGYQYCLVKEKLCEVYTIDNNLVLYHRVLNEDKTFECSVCYESYELWKTECNHVICISCVDKFYRNQQETLQKKCFYCRKMFKMLD